MNKLADVAAREQMIQRIQLARRRSAEVLDVPEFHGLFDVLDAGVASRWFYQELNWYYEPILADDEKRWQWFCHEVRDGVLRFVLNPRVRGFLRDQYRVWTGRLIASENLVPEDTDRAWLHYCFGAVGEDMVSPEVWSLNRELLHRLLAKAPPLQNPGEDALRCLERFARYEALGEEATYLKWVGRGYEGESPDPACMDSDSMRQSNQFCNAVLGGKLRVSFFTPQEAARVMALSREYDALLGGAVQTQDRTVLGHVEVEFCRAACRSIIRSMHGTDAWERLRDDLAVAASTARLSVRPEERQWAAALELLRDTLDRFYRGEHPMLMAVLLRQYGDVLAQFAQSLKQDLAKQPPG